MIPETRLIHTVTKKSRASTTTKGDPTYGAASTFKARVVKSRKNVKNNAGTEVVSTAMFATRTLVTMDDIFWLPAVSSTDTADDTTTDAAARSPISIDGPNVDGVGDRAMWLVYL
jgi:hypothetical protein